MVLVFECADCGNGAEYFAEGEPADAQAERAAYWDAAREFKGRGWSISSNHPTRCPDCYKKRNEGILDRAVERWRWR